eukprot:TRINITY_DN187_c0_g1_i2.p1 TRINITY_DN187_c0_g1~~TRINITY_DN187_c0_g1_i2.p1  ORF type:complete len:272 (-),score=93.04 TRINITY_DN187_c0_g1_i2:110-883(-)
MSFNFLIEEIENIDSNQIKKKKKKNKNKYEEQFEQPRFIISLKLLSKLQFILPLLQNLSTELYHQLEIILKKVDSQNSKQITISYNFIKKLSKLLLENRAKLPKDCPMYVNQFLQHSQLYIRPLPVKPRDPIIAAKIENLKREQENREYRQMTKRFSTSISEKKRVDGLHLRSFNSQIAVGLNIIVAMATLFTAGYYVTSKMYPGSTKALITGIACATIALLVEVWLFILGMVQLEKVTEQKNKKVQSKSKILNFDN